VLSARSVPRRYHEENLGNQVCSVRDAVKKTVSWKGAGIQRGLVPESRSFCNVKAVTRERLVKTHQDGKDLAYVVVICKVWSLTVALELLVVPSCVYKLSINPISNPKICL
jgi:hypothetical protein